MTAAAVSGWGGGMKTEKSGRTSPSGGRRLFAFSATVSARRWRCAYTVSSMFVFVANRKYTAAQSIRRTDIRTCVVRVDVPLGKLPVFVRKRDRRRLTVSPSRYNFMIVNLSCTRTGNKMRWPENEKNDSPRFSK